MSPRRSPLFRKIGNPRRSPLSSASPLPSPLHRPVPPALVLSNSDKRMDQSGLFNSGKSLILSNSGKWVDQSEKYVKQVTGRHNETKLHPAMQLGDLAVVREILSDIDAQMVGMTSDDEFDSDLAEIRSSVLIGLGKPWLFTGAEKGHLYIVVELQKYSKRNSIVRKNMSRFDMLHVVSKEKHLEFVRS